MATLYVDTESFRLTTDIEARERVAGYAGRLVPGKGLEEILEAANISKGQGIRFRIIGDGPLRPWIERRLAAGDLPHVELCGWMNQDDLIEALNQMKLLILPSAAECLPNIVLEAMACGTPALATPVGGVPDLVEDEVTGFLLQPAIPEAIAARLSYALNHPRLATISKAARARVETEYSLVASTRRWRAIMGASWKN